MFLASLQLSQSTMTTTQLAPGIYRIVVVGGVEPACLTRQEGGRVTILPSSAQPDPEQQWRIVPGRDGNIIIERPSRIFPISYLSYNDAPKKPEEGDRVVYRLSEFPPNEWHLAIAPGFRSLIRVAGSDLGIRVAPLTIFPPFLDLGLENQLEWVFERVQDE